MQSSVSSILKSKFCSGRLCARYRVAHEAGAAYVSDSLYPNMRDVAHSIIMQVKKASSCETADSQYQHSSIARQPIFARNMGIYGYELLYRKGNDNFFVQIDDDQATADIIYNSFLVFGLSDLTDGAKAFINFSKELIESDMPSLLPKKNIVIEVLERSQTTQATVEACRRIKDLGYSLALDDFVFNKDDLPLLEFADIVKVDFLTTSPDAQSSLIKKYGHKIRFLAEKVETREDYSRAVQLGYDYFQGYFFCKPAMLYSKEVASLNVNLYNILKELNTIDPSFSRIASIIQGDLGLSIKLLKLANSVYFGSRSEIKSILHALSFIGANEMYQWISIMLLRDYTNIENAELIRLSFIRAKFMELLSRELQPAEDPSDYFFTGMFSLIDILLNQSMDQVLKGLPLPTKVKMALRGQDNAQHRLLECVIAYETSNLSDTGNEEIIRRIEPKKLITHYVDSIKWMNSLNY